MSKRYSIVVPKQLFTIELFTEGIFLAAKLQSCNTCFKAFLNEFLQGNDHGDNGVNTIYTFSTERRIFLVRIVLLFGFCRQNIFFNNLTTSCDDRSKQFKRKSEILDFLDLNFRHFWSKF